MRYVILGAGAIGGAIGGRLFEHGHDVVLVARGAHLEALSRRGLELRDPERTAVLRIPTAPSPAEVDFGRDDVAIIAVKSQQTASVLVPLFVSAPADIPVVCAQNGVANEREALRHFGNVQAMCVFMPATHIEPGVVEIPVSPLSGVLDLGRYPSGADAVSTRLAEALTESSYVSRADEKVMAAKYRKLLSNLSNAIEAASGTLDDEDARRLSRLAEEEALACYEAAGIEVAEKEAYEDRRRVLGELRQIDGRDFRMGSSYQSLQRATGDIEADWLNGEIVLLGRLHGVPTPVNALLQATANRMALERRAPGTIPAAELLAQL